MTEPLTSTGRAQEPDREREGQTDAPTSGLDHDARLSAYQLPDGELVAIREDIARGAAEVSFTKKGGDIVMARKTDDELCQHGVPMDVHCCACRRGGHTATKHRCPDAPLMATPSAVRDPLGRQEDWIVEMRKQAEFDRDNRRLNTIVDNHALLDVLDRLERSSARLDDAQVEEIRTVMTQVDLTMHREENCHRHGITRPTIEDWKERVRWMYSVLLKLVADNKYRLLDAAAKAAPVLPSPDALDKEKA